MNLIRRLLLTPSGRRVHLAKTLSWRVAATTTTILVTYAVTGDLLVGATVGSIEATAKMALYYGHERAWARLLHSPAAPRETGASHTTAPDRSGIGQRVR